MFGEQPVIKPQILHFLLVPDFSMMAFTSAIEPLRAANLRSGEALYRWRIVSDDGQPVQASNGFSLLPDASIDDESPDEAVFVCAGLGVEHFHHPRVFAWLKKLARRGVALGGLCTGSLILARAGVLDGFRCTAHWENMEGFVSEFPQLDITATLFEIDRKRYTCSGGTAPLDMMIHSIAKDHGEDLAIEVAEQMLHTGIRHPHDTQRLSIQHRTGITHPKLLAVIAHMEAFLEIPMALPDIAAAVGLSIRQMERLFHDKTGKKPSRYYLELRLQRAHQLLVQTTMPVLQIAVACGFTSAAHFSKCYRDRFGKSPRNEREHLPRIPA